MNFFSLLACSVCFGDPGSLQSKGVVMGVFVLLAVVVIVLGGIAGVAFKWIRTSRRIESR